MGRHADGADTIFLSLLNSVAYAGVVPALRKVREERGTHFILDTSEIKSLGPSPKSGQAELQFSGQCRTSV